jgi:hypothetical protein
MAHKPTTTQIQTIVEETPLSRRGTLEIGGRLDEAFGRRLDSKEFDKVLREAGYEADRTGRPIAQYGYPIFSL